MNPITEAVGTGSFLMSEANGTLSRDAGVLASGQNLPAGAVVYLATGKWTEVVKTKETDAAGILLAATDASAADTPCVVITRDAEVNGKELTWNAVTETAPVTATAIAALAAVGVIVR